MIGRSIGKCSSNGAAGACSCANGRVYQPCSVQHEYCPIDLKKINLTSELSHLFLICTNVQTLNDA